MDIGCIINTKKLTSCHKLFFLIPLSLQPEAKFKEVEPRLDAVQTWLVPLKIIISVSSCEPALNWNRLLVQRLGFNSLNSISDAIELLCY